MWRGENAQAGCENPCQDPCPQPTPDLYTPTSPALTPQQESYTKQTLSLPSARLDCSRPSEGNDGVPPAAALPPAPGLADLPRRRLVVKTQPLLALDPPLWRQERRPRSRQCLRIILVGCRRGAFWACVVDPRSSLSSLLEGGDLRADLASYPPASPDSSLCLVRVSSLVGDTSSCTMLTPDPPLALVGRGGKDEDCECFNCLLPKFNCGQVRSSLPSLPPFYSVRVQPLTTFPVHFPISLESATSLTDSASVLLDSVGSTVSRLVRPRLPFRQVLKLSLLTPTFLLLLKCATRSPTDLTDIRERLENCASVMRDGEESIATVRLVPLSHPRTDD